MGRLNPFSKPKAPDNRALLSQQREVAEREKRMAEQEAQRESEEERRRKATASARRGAQAGSRSLLSGLETGVTPEGGRRASLG